MLERYVYKNQKKMRCGYTTGTCACAAAKAAAYMLLSGRKVKEIKVITPMGVSLTLPVIDIDIKKDKVICAIKKDSGDDPDVTNGIKIYAQVTYVKEDIMRTINTDGVIVDGGIGVGRVTKKGLKCAVGEAAGVIPSFSFSGFPLISMRANNRRLTLFSVLSACMILMRLSMEFCTVAQSVRLSLSRL